MKKALPTSLLVLAAALAWGHPVKGEDPKPWFPDWQPPIPRDGLDRPAAGLISMPRELECWGAVLHRRADVEASGVVFRYIVESELDRAAASGTITVHSFREAEEAHRALELVLRQPNMSGTAWPRVFERAELPDLVYRSREGRGHTFIGVTRHVFFRLDARASQDASPAELQRLSQATTQAASVVVKAIEAAGSALAGAPRSIGEVRLERLPAPSSIGPDCGEIRLTVLPRLTSAGQPEQMLLYLYWRLPGEVSHWQGRQTHVWWFPKVIGATHGQAPVIPLSPREASGAQLELRLLRPHDSGPTFALEEVDFQIDAGARTTTWRPQ